MSSLSSMPSPAPSLSKSKSENDLSSSSDLSLCFFFLVARFFLEDVALDLAPLLLDLAVPRGVTTYVLAQSVST